MLFVDDLEKIIMLIILSQQFEDKKPVNLMLVAKSESGGSTMLKQFDNIKGVYFTNDITYKGLIDRIKNMSANIQVIIISDYNKILSRPFTTRMNFETVLNQVIEEGTKNIDLPGEMRLSLDKYISISVITKVTTEMYTENILTWYNSGFIQRFLIIKYSYTEDEIKEIMKSITHSKLLENIKYKIPELKRITINCKEEYNEKLTILSQQITMAYGFRAQKQLQLLLKAQALFRHLDDKTNKKLDDIKIDVNEDDLKEIIRLSDYFYKPHITIKSNINKKGNLLKNWIDKVFK